VTVVVQGRIVKRCGKSLASGAKGSERLERIGVGGAGEVMIATGASVMGGRRFSTRISASRTCSMTSLNCRWT
jgi:hypothetical protein